jgi:hypothetical protein
MYSYVGETVLDPFLGSGTTIKVARELGREGVGYERDLRYKATIMEKLGLAHAAPVDDAQEGYLAKTRNVAEAVKLIPQVHTGSPALEEQTESDSEPEVSLIMSEGIAEEVNNRVETALEPA